MATQIKTRDDEIRVIHREYRAFYQIAGRALLVLMGVWIGSLIFAHDGGYSTNLYTEILSIAVTVFILDRLNERRATGQLKRRLVREAGGRANDTALSAVDWLRHEGWLTGENGLLQGKKLSRAKLEGADLHEANLIRADLSRAKLMEANLGGANLVSVYLHGADLTNSRLYRANLENALMSGCNLSGAYLRHAYLKNADLNEANLQGTNLFGANLTGVDLRGSYLKNARLKHPFMGAAILDDAILPNGVLWTPDTDMERFTNPEHPDFWQPDWV